MTRRTMLAVCLATVGVAAAAPIPKSLKKKLLPSIKEATDEVLSAWAEDQDEWLRLCKDQWPPRTIFHADLQEKLDRGEDVGQEQRFETLRGLRSIWRGKRP